jgi:hypothetical protein
MEKLNKILLINNIKKYIVSFTEKNVCKHCKLKREYLYYNFEYCLYCSTTFKSVEYIKYLRNKRIT